MSKKVIKDAPPLQSELWDELEELVKEKMLDDVFYPKSEHKECGLLTMGFVDNHPLHPEFIAPSKTMEYGYLTVANPRYKAVDLETLTHTQRNRVNAHWQKIRSLEIYKWLQKNSFFSEAYKTFEYLKSRSKSPAYKHPYADFRFLWLVAFYVGGFITTSGKAFVRHHLSASEKKLAMTHIDNLLEDFNVRGVRIPNETAQETLANLLGRLREHIAFSVKPRADKTQEYRELHAFMSLDMQGLFGKASPKIVINLSRIVTSTLGHKALEERVIEGHIARARSR